MLHDASQRITRCISSVSYTQIHSQRSDIAPFNLAVGQQYSSMQMILICCVLCIVRSSLSFPWPDPRADAYVTRGPLQQSTKEHISNAVIHTARSVSSGINIQQISSFCDAVT